MHIRDIETMLAAGQRPVVEFGKDFDNEDYAETGMRARVTSVTDEGDGCFRVYVDFSEFDAHNEPFETSNYFDKRQNQCLTARQAGYYKPQSSVWVPSELDGWIALVESTGYQTFTEYKASGTSLSYIAWLESELQKLRNSEPMKLAGDLFLEKST